METPNKSHADNRRQTTRTTNCLSLRNNAALLHSSASSALSAGEYLRKSTQAICTNDPIISLSQITLIIADKPQNKLQTVFLCDIMQLSCIPLRHLRYLRENIHIRVLKIYCTNETPMSPADLADDADEPQNDKTTITIKQT